MSDFIKKANIEQIGVPIFIAHGGDIDAKTIFQKFKRINKISLYDIETIFISISLPLINKQEFMESFTKAKPIKNG